MRVKLTEEQVKKILEDPAAARQSGVKVSDPWWVIVLKVIAYVIGLVLAGATTTSCAHLIASSLG